MARSPIHCSWLPELAAGYLRAIGAPAPLRRSGLWGYRFSRRRGRRELGLFVGFLTRSRNGASGLSSLHLEPPECAVFAFVHPAASDVRRRLVRRDGSLFRRSYDLLTKYTARWPRFEFHEEDWAALIRHVPLAQFPARRRELFARNFFIETLALVVRSGLAGKLARVRLAGS